MSMFTCNTAWHQSQSISPQCKPHCCHHSAGKPTLHSVGMENNTVLWLCTSAYKYHIDKKCMRLDFCKYAQNKVWVHFCTYNYSCIFYKSHGYKSTIRNLDSVIFVILFLYCKINKTFSCTNFGGYKHSTTIYSHTVACIPHKWYNPCEKIKYLCVTNLKQT